MTRLRLKSLILPLALLCVIANAVRAQPNGMYYDHRNNYLIPLQQGDALVGHAYVLLADKISRDSASFVVGVYDQYLVNVGEKRVNLPTSYQFDCAAFDGKDLYTRFIDEGKALRYIVFDQQARTVFDTTLRLACRKTPANRVAYYQQASIFPVEGAGIVDNVLRSGGAYNSATIRVGPGRSVWVADDVAALNSANRVLHADESVVVEAVYDYASTGTAPVVKQTSIVTLDARTGRTIGTTVLTGGAAQHIYPVNAAVQGGEVSVVSQFTRQPKKYGRVKYGVCIHTLNAAGSVQNSSFNEFTTTMLKKDSTSLNGRPLLTASYLHVSHAAPLSNGRWVLAMQQFSKRHETVRLLKNKVVTYDLKSMVFAELDGNARIVSSHAEANKSNPVRLPRAFFTAPQGSGTYLYTTMAADVSYFAKPSPTSDQVSFVYADVGEDQQLVVGNVLYKGGKFKTDKFNAGGENGYAFAGMLPARFGHTYLIRFSGLTGGFDFDNIKFNN